ncbi:CPBP family intramembrane glutamic endopeptidase [Salinimicrobium sp. GXAS 041]|uniref:CPBP family intramembrane glutamic endopeptidase n=1 Tax=Salinimicrobium sp. GXAS 041 TaxID=3400806 RepID=UPI003C77EDC9
MKTKIYNFLTKPYIVVLTMLIAPLFGFIDRNFVFFFGLGVAFLILWSGNFEWSKFGIRKKLTRRTVIHSLLITVAIYILFGVFIDPILQHYLGDFDLSSVDDIRGNLVGYIILMGVMWVFAAFGEEFLFRGYYMKSLAELFGDSNKAWFLSAIITSIYFGISHAYQGVVGIVSVFLWSFLISTLFYKNRNNLLLLVLVHGFTDTIGLTLIYLNKDHLFSEWIKQIF